MDKAKPTITVITIVKDIVKSGRKDLLRECIESVSGQTYQNIQHILMDGKSSDGTLELLEELKGIFGDRLEIHSQKDQSIDEAYNNALRYAKGKYVFFMNSDDKYYSSQALEHCFEAMEREQADYYRDTIEMTISFRLGFLISIFFGSPCHFLIRLWE